MGFKDEIIADARNKIRLKNRADNSISAFEDILSRIGPARQEAKNRASLTADDLYGESMTRATDNIRSNANNTKMVLGRASAASGGDVSGARSVTFDNIDENANKAIGGVTRQYSDRAEAANERSRGRADRLLSLLLSGQGNLSQMEIGRYEADKMRDLQEKQAKRQFWADILGVGGNIIGSS